MNTLEKILEKVNEKCKGEFKKSDRVMIGDLHEKLIADKKLVCTIKTGDTRSYFVDIFPTTFGAAAKESYIGSLES